MKRSVGAVATACLLAVTFAAQAGCAGGEFIQQVVTGSGKLVTNTFDFSGFDRIEVSSVFEAEISPSNTFSVTTTTDDNVFEYVEVTKSGGTLVVRLKPGVVAIHATQRVAVAMPDLRSVSISGASRGKVSEFATNNSVQLAASGASTMELQAMKTGNTDIVVSGASRVTGTLEITGGSLVVSGASTVELTGSGGTIRLDDSGASSARLADFPVVNASATVSGASNAAITLSGRLDADVSGASRLTYGGSGTLGRVNVTGASTLTKR